MKMKAFKNSVCNIDDFLGFENRCIYCGAPTIEHNESFRNVVKIKDDLNISFDDCLKLERTVEHLLPKSLGGSDDRENLAIACKHCNQLRANLNTVEGFKKFVRELLDEGKHHSRAVRQLIERVDDSSVEEPNVVVEEDTATTSTEDCLNSEKKQQKTLSAEDVDSTTDISDVVKTLTSYMLNQGKKSVHVSALGNWLIENYNECKPEEYFGHKKLTNFLKAYPDYFTIHRYPDGSTYIVPKKLI